MRYEVREDPEGYDGWEKVLVRIDAGEETVIFGDGIEPEDAILCRDLDVFVAELKRNAEEIEELRTEVASLQEEVETAFEHGYHEGVDSVREFGVE